MSRFLAICSLGLITMLTLNAGQIQLSGTGPVNNNVAGFGLTGSIFSSNPPQYIQSTPNCAGSQYYSNSCAAAQQGGTSGVQGTRKGGYAVQLFSLATGVTGTPDASNGNGLWNGGTVSPSGSGIEASTFSSPSNGTPVTFDLMNAPNSANGYNQSGGAVCTNCMDANYWASFSGNDFVIPVGVSGVDSAYTMLNDVWGGSGQNITVSFCFSATSNGTCTSNQLVVVPLTAGVEYRASVICNSSVAGSCPTQDSQNISTTLAASTSNVGGSGVTVNTGTVFTSAYSGIPVNNPTGSQNQSPWAGSTSGSVVLDDQQYLFGSNYAGEYLSYIMVQDSFSGSYSYSSTDPTGSGINGVSRFALSAVTVDTVPEPGSIFLALAGFGMIGVSRLRRRG